MDIKEAIESLGGKCSKCSESKEQLLRFHFKGNAPNIIYFSQIMLIVQQSKKSKKNYLSVNCFVLNAFEI
jgi:hypothetical protein